MNFMSAPEVAQQAEECEGILRGTPRLNNLLHNLDFVESVMSKLKTIFGDIDFPLDLALNQISAILRGHDNIKSIIKDECGDLSHLPIYSFFLFYCSIVVYVEHIRITKLPITRGA